MCNCGCNPYGYYSQYQYNYSPYQYYSGYSYWAPSYGLPLGYAYLPPSTPAVYAAAAPALPRGEYKMGNCLCICQ